MVDVSDDSGQRLLILKPNRSMTWRENKYLLGVVFCWSGAIGIGFLIMGAWVIMPFIGLELAALAAALYYVSWKISHCEVLRIDAETIVVEKGIRWPKKSWRWARDAVRINVQLADHPWQSPVIEMVAGDDKRVRLGEFLNVADCKKLTDELINAGLIVRRGSRSAKVAF